VSRIALLRWVYAAVDPAFVAPIEPTFDDVPRSHPAFRVVEWTTQVGLLSGYGDGTFRPGSALPRATAAAILTKASALLDADR
jgi:hypothetical protein